MRVHLAFCVQDTRFYRVRFGCFANVIRQLAIEKMQTVGSADAQFHARGKIKKNAIERRCRHLICRSWTMACRNEGLRREATSQACPSGTLRVAAAQLAVRQSLPAEQVQRPAHSD